MQVESNEIKFQLELKTHLEENIEKLISMIIDAI